jgi:uncharacterized membrane protein YdjX (TVP38/TMEM64 family)
MKYKKNGKHQFIEKHPFLISGLAVSFSLLIFGLALAFRDKLMGLEKLGLAGVFFISFFGSASVLLPLPGLFGSFVAGGIFSPTMVGLVGAMGATCGELIGYFAGLSGYAVIREKKKFKFIKKSLHSVGTFALFVFAAIPNPFFDLAGIAAGAIRLPLNRFFLAAFLGQVVKYLIAAHLGAKIINVFP